MATKKAALRGYAKGGKVAKRGAANKRKPKSKMPTLGGSLVGLAGTGSQGMIP